jgi:uncharacterized protein (TIGR02594 family)
MNTTRQAAPLRKESTMSKLPAAYSWLAAEPAPKVLLEALALFGVKEVPGSGDNPEILSWAAELGLAATYPDDQIPWCGLFAAIVVKRAGYEPVASPLWARSWAMWGTAAERAMLGDMLVFTRPGGGGHVGFYVGEDTESFHVLGGNQSDAVTITRILRSRCIARRRSPWRVAQPPNVRVVRLAASGVISKNES